MIYLWRMMVALNLAINLLSITCLTPFTCITHGLLLLFYSTLACGAYAMMWLAMPFFFSLLRIFDRPTFARVCVACGTIYTEKKDTGIILACLELAAAPAYPLQAHVCARACVCTHFSMYV